MLVFTGVVLCDQVLSEDRRKVHTKCVFNVNDAPHYIEVETFTSPNSMIPDVVHPAADKVYSLVGTVRKPNNSECLFLVRASSFREVEIKDGDVSPPIICLVALLKQVQEGATHAELTVTTQLYGEGSILDKTFTITRKTLFQFNLFS